MQGTHALGTNGFYQLVYISTARPNFHPVEVRDILAVSRQRNAEVQVTGLLVYDGKRFLQALEGSREAVRATFDRIRDDVRHRAVVVLSEKTIDQREFGEWAMAAEEVQQMKAGGSLTDAVDALVEGVASENERERFRSFIRLRHGNERSL